MLFLRKPSIASSGPKTGPECISFLLTQHALWRWFRTDDIPWGLEFGRE